MKLAVSNLAWDPPEDADVASLLSRFAVDAIDLVPGKYFPDPAAATDSDIRQVRQWWASRGIAITGMQALLFGTSGLNLFGTSASRKAMLRHLGALCRIAGLLAAPRLVFGSPRNRDRGILTDPEVGAVANQFFRELGDIAAGHGVIVCLEPNPTRYGANYMTTSAETAQVVGQIGHPAIRMQFDTGALAINGEDPLTVLRNCCALIGHVHASEPDLLPIGDGGTDHAAMAAAVRQCLPQHLVSMEMVATRSEPHLASIGRALGSLVRHYRPSEAAP